MQQHLMQMQPMMAAYASPNQVTTDIIQQSVSLYPLEMALARYRGAIFNIYDIYLTSAILIVNLVNYDIQNIEDGWGWRLSLSAATLFAAFLALSALFIPKTATSIIQLL